jgi:hypothetical protein
VGCDRQTSDAKRHGLKREAADPPAGGWGCWFVCFGCVGLCFFFFFLRPWGVGWGALCLCLCVLCLSVCEGGDITF